MQGSKKKRRKTSSSRGGGSNGKGYSCSFETRLKAVKLFLEEGLTQGAISREVGVSRHTISKWVARYRKDGEDGLKTRSKGKTGSRTSPAVKDKIVEVKKKNPSYGKKRISQILRRIFFLKASPDTVQKTLKEEGLADTPQKKKKRRKNVSKPRFFERARPNQMWQSDIMTFRLGGRNAYLIGFMDDYSRYIVGMDLFRSQTAEHVLEVYRKALAEYGVPKEVLTDNGRQYTNWRGTTRFEHELKKDNIRHIRSAPHHPMTLGKIERFWRTIFTEFLSRVQFGCFEEAQERVRLWVKYYNHRRPHQGIGGLCPADRLFEIQHELRKVIEEGIQDNVLELALRGKPQDPFYMVGRMGGQSVVIRAEKGKVKMSVDTKEGPVKEIEYPMENQEGSNDQKREEAHVQDIHGNGEGTGGAVDMEREEAAVRSMPGTRHQMGASEQLAETCARGYAGSVGAEERRGEQGHSCDRRQTEEASGQEDSAGHEEPVQAAAASYQYPGEERGCEEGVVKERYERKESETPCGSYPEGTHRPDNSQGRCKDPGRIPQDILSVGEAGSGRDDGSSFGETCRQETEGDGPGEGESEKSGEGSFAGEHHSSHEPSYQRGSDGRRYERFSSR